MTFLVYERDWRTMEGRLVRHFDLDGWIIISNPESGNKVAQKAADVLVDLTELAKELAL